MGYDPFLQAAIGTGIFHIPRHRDPESICEDFLREIYLHTMKHIRKRIGGQVFDITPMDCWLTVPATWSDRAKDATVAAAKRAGFGSRSGDGKLKTITEPEAAALVALKQYEAGESLNPIKVVYISRILLLSLLFRRD